MAGYGMRLLVPYFLVRLLTVPDFASYRQFFLVEITIATIFRVGVSHSLYYFIPRDEENAGAYFLNSLALNLSIYAAVFAGIWFLRDWLATTLNMPLFVDYFPQLLAYMTAIMFVSAGDAYLTSRQQVKAAAVFSVVTQLIVSIVTVVVTFGYRDVGAVFTAMTVVTWVSVVIMVAYIALALQGFRAERYFFGIWTQVRYSMVLGLGGALWIMQSRIHEIFISKYYGQELFAVYSAGCTQIPIVDFYIQSVAVVSLGQFAMMAKHDDWDGVLKLWRQILTSLYGITIPGIILLLLLSKPLMTFMFPEFAGAVDVFRVNSLVKISMLWNAQLVLRGIDRNDVVVYVCLVSMALTPFALYLGMTLGGMYGVIWAQLGLMVLSRFGLQYVNNRITPRTLPYTVSVAEVWKFYRDSWEKGAALVRGIIAR